MVIDIPIIKCNRCGHEWTPRIADPRQCPGCHSIRWDKEESKCSQKPL